MWAAVFWRYGKLKAMFICQVVCRSSTALYKTEQGLVKSRPLFGLWPTPLTQISWPPCSLMFMETNVWKFSVPYLITTANAFAIHLIDRNEI